MSALNKRGKHLRQLANRRVQPLWCLCLRGVWESLSWDRRLERASAQHYVHSLHFGILLSHLIQQTSSLTCHHSSALPTKFSRTNRSEKSMTSSTRNIATPNPLLKHQTSSFSASIQNLSSPSEPSARNAIP
jgi:hypothetical protein